ncbi:MAG: hypothetical protein AABY10_00810 [Nanoarchaeota archaeon]
MRTLKLEVDNAINDAVNSQRQLTFEEKTSREYRERAAMMYVSELLERQADFRWEDRDTRYIG